ncbi:MAG: hypothetical protein CM1200mP41_23840 [Gammaproteobacteria bacterium]|nr:MAG: hypothetical protein CM1200mP41_23840 [Gammaproteobacteria bacterium]
MLGELMRLEEVLQLRDPWENDNNQLDCGDTFNCGPGPYFYCWWLVKSAQGSARLGDGTTSSPRRMRVTRHFPTCIHWWR